ncbi:MAG TPA: hypothetical protein VGP92_12855 [Acidimicrobiia bacterium]|nr:hypothetical protein [Acidimicrobiia bacterium]
MPRTETAVDPKGLVLTASDVPDGNRASSGRADLFDETAKSFQSVLDAAGVTEFTGAFTSEIKVGHAGDSVQSLAVVTKSPSAAGAVFGVCGDLFTFTGLAGGLPTQPIPTLPPLGTTAVGRMGRDGNGRLSAGACWHRGRVVSVVIVTMTESPIALLGKLARIQDQRVANHA